MPGEERSAEDHHRTSRFTTSDLIGPTLIFLGAFLLAVAAALPTLVVDDLRTISLSTDVTTVAPSATTTSDTGSSTARILDRCSLNTPGARVLDAGLTRQQRVLAVRPADAHRVTLQAGTSTRIDHLVIDGKSVDPQVPRAGSDALVPAGADACTNPTVAAVKDRITLNRSTALPDLSHGGSSEIQYDSRRAPVLVPDRNGYTYMFGFDTVEPGITSLHYFDVATRTSVPLTAVADAKVHHGSVRLRAQIPDVDIHQLSGSQADLSGNSDATPPTIITRPASWFAAGGVTIPGDPARSLSATLHRRSTVEMSVDSSTGTILDQTVTVDEDYRFAEPDLANASLTSLSGTFGYDTRTKRALSRQATALKAPVSVWGRVVPIFAAIAGVALLAAGIVILHPALDPRPRVRRWWIRRTLPLRRRRRARQLARRQPESRTETSPEDTTPSS